MTNYGFVTPMKAEPYSMRGQITICRKAYFRPSEVPIEHLFINYQTGKPYVTIMKVWTRLRNKAGLPHLRIHDLRHSFASFLVNSGRTLYEVQQILGHSQSIVTERYAHLSTKTLLAASDSASVIIQGAMQQRIQAVAVPAIPVLAEVKEAA